VEVVPVEEDVDAEVFKGEDRTTDVFVRDVLGTDLDAETDRGVEEHGIQPIPAPPDAAALAAGLGGGGRCSAEEAEADDA
ncbi:hypothetical protein ABTN13_20780, partial [Acinetobacter baumannii]